MGFVIAEPKIEKAEEVEGRGDDERKENKD